MESAKLFHRDSRGRPAKLNWCAAAVCRGIVNSDPHPPRFPSFTWSVSR
jgi:hypothetical protein